MFREIPVRLHGDGDDDALDMSDAMVAAYSDARTYCEQIAKVRPAAGILKTLLLRRIGSSLRAGLLTARKLRIGEEAALFAEEEVNGPGGPVTTQARKPEIVWTAPSVTWNRPVMTTQNSLPYYSGCGLGGRSGGAFCSVNTLTQSSGSLDIWRWHFLRSLSASMVGRITPICSKRASVAGHPRQIQAQVRHRSLRILVATDAASEGLNLQRLETLINIDLPWNPARLEQRKGRIDRLGQLASEIDILNLRYHTSVEDEVHRALSTRLRQIRDVFGTIPDTLEDIWVDTALGDLEAARRRIEDVPARHPFDVRYSQDLPASNGSGARRCWIAWMPYVY